jgi:hypothetical protein
MKLQCINIQVSGSGSTVPAGTPATSLYKATDVSTTHCYILLKS